MPASQGLIGWVEATEIADCDAPSGGSVYLASDGKTYCRCVVCSRCGHHTGNSHQGHAWSYCSKTGEKVGFHFCCPDLPCEYPEGEINA
jgi:hypothetical protein